MSHAYLVEGDTEIAAHWYPFAVNQLAMLKRLGIKTRTMTPADDVLILIGTNPEKIFISAGLSGFLFKHRWTSADQAADPTHIAGELSGKKSLLTTSKNGFDKIKEDVKLYAGLSYWTNNKDTLISWNTQVHDTNTYNDTAAPYNVIGKYPYTDDEVFINGSSIGKKLRPFADELRNGGVYYAKVGKYLIAIQYGTRTSTQFFPQGIFSAYFVVYHRDYLGIAKTFIDNLSFRKIHINAAGTKMICIAKVLPKVAPAPIGTDIPQTMTVHGTGAVRYTTIPPFSYPKTGNDIFVNYWEAVIEYDIVLTGNEADPVHLVEVSRVDQYAIVAAMKRAAGTTPPIDYTLLAKFENTEVITDAWFDVETQALVTETITDIVVTSWGKYQYTINNPNIATPLVQTVDCTGTSKSGAGYVIMANNPYVKNAVVTVCDFTGIITESPPANSGTMTAVRYDERGAITFDAISDKTYAQTHITGWLYPFLYQWHSYTYDTSAGISEYSFPYGTIFEQSISSGWWQQIAPSVHFQRGFWNYTDERVDNSGVLSDRYGNILYFYGEDDFVMRCIESPNQRFKALKKGFIAEPDFKQARIADAIKFSEDIIGVV